MTIVKFSWGFNLDYAAFTLAGVIWMIGWCMVLMSLLVRTGLSPRAIGLLGVAIVVIQPVFTYAPRLLPGALQPTVGPFWEFIYPAGAEAAGGFQVLYVIVPWIGVMAAGYGFGLIAAREDEARRRLCLRIGLGATALFLLVAIPAALMQPASPESPPVLFRVLGQNKYPASLLFLLMTLGPTIALLPIAERARGWLARVFETFGRVPMFYYLLHIPAIHLATLVTAWLRGDGIHHEWYRSAPFAQVPPSARWSLGELYLVFAIVVVVLYFPCAWYARLKMRPSRPRWMTLHLEVETGLGPVVRDNAYMSQLASVFPPGGAIAERGVDLEDAEDLRCSVRIGRTHHTDCGQRQIFARLDDSARVVHWRSATQ